MNFDVESIKRKMLIKYPFFGSIVANIEYKENKNISTAGTDGKVVYYNPTFFAELNETEQIFVFAHEICHIAFNHILRSEGKDKNTWNTATDAVINAFLKSDGLTMPKNAVDIHDAINYNAEQLYDKLLEQKQNNQQKQQDGDSSQMISSNETSNSSSSSSNNSNQNNEVDNNSSNSTQTTENNGSSSNEESTDEKDNSNKDVGHDTHDMWDDAVKEHKKEQEKKNEKKENLFDKLFNRNKEQEEKNEVEKKQDEITEMGEKEAFKKNKQEKKKQLEQLKRELSQQSSGFGTTTNSNIRSVGEIGSAKPIIDWRYVLREAVKLDVDWSYKNATIEDGVVSANLEEIPIPETEIVLDTSGSINESLLRNFLKECKNILQHSKVKVGCFDTMFYGFEEIRTEKDIEKMEFRGGGGTDFDVAVGAFSRRVENKIIFTDGEANMPEMPLDAIWIVFGGRRINPKGGKVIHITDEQLRRLYYYVEDNMKSGRSR